MALEWFKALSKRAPETKPAQITSVSGEKVLNSQTLWAFDIDPYDHTVIGSPQTFMSAMDRSVWVHACVDRITTDSLEAPLVLMRGRGPNKQRIYDHPLLDLLEDVNEYQMNAGSFRTSIMYSLLLRGQAFIEVVNNRANTLPAALYWLHPDAVTPKPDAKKFVSGYKVQNSQNTSADLSPDDVIWLRKFNPDNQYDGLSPLRALRRAIELDHNAETAQSSSFANGAMTAGLVSPKGDMNFSESATKDLARQFKSEHGGAGNAHSVMFSSSPLDFQAMGLSATDSQWLETRKWSLVQICNVFKVPPALLTPEFSSYSNMKASRAMLWEEAIVPWLRFLCEELNHTLVRRYDPDRRLGLRLEPDLSEVSALMPDWNIQETELRADVMAGLRTINETRAMRGELPVSWGDRWYAPFTVAPVSSDGETPRVAPAIQPDPLIGKSKSKANLRGLRTPQQRRKIGEQHGKSLDAITASFQKDLAKAFEEQRAAVLAKLPRKSKELNPKLVSVSAAEALKKAAKKAYVQAGSEAYASVSEQLGAETTIGFDLSNPRIQALVKEMLKRITDVDETTVTDLQDTIAEGLRRNYSVEQIARGVESEGYGGINGVMDEASTSRSLMVARTESTWAFSRSSTAAYGDAGLEKKEWLTGIGDDKTGVCRDLDGEVVGIDEAFSDGSFAPPDPHPNCTCSILPVLPDGYGE